MTGRAISRSGYDREGQASRKRSATGHCRNGSGGATLSRVAQALLRTRRLALVPLAEEYLQFGRWPRVAMCRPTDRSRQTS